MIPNRKIGTEENYVEIKGMMSFWEKRQYQSGYSSTFSFDKKATKFEVDTKARFEDTADFYLLQTQVETIVENGEVVYTSKDRRKLVDVLKNLYGENEENLEKALEEIKQVNKLIKKVEDEEEEKNV